MFDNLYINGERLEKTLKDFAVIGATEKGGVTRLALTDEDKQARDLFVRLVEEAGCSVSIDHMGNIFARRAGRQPDAASVLMGSHGDSQPKGGRFDGIYGVLGGLEVLRSMNDLSIQTDRPVDLVMWTNEEGSRFAPAMIGSAVFTGTSSLEYGLSRADAQGITIGDELQRIGYAGNADMTDYKIHAAYELHIEQGPILEKNQCTIGVVTDAQGQRWYEITLTGQAAHAGSTPMEMRHDALLGMSRLVEQVNRIALHESPDGRGTVGMLSVSPNSRNVVPGEVWFCVEFRHPSEEKLARMDATMCQVVHDVCEKIELQYNINCIFSYEPVPFDRQCNQTIREAAESLGYSYQDIISGAGHDACHLARIVPTSMIFVPCEEGLSHNEAENITEEWAVAGANVLLRTVVKSATNS